MEQKKIAFKFVRGAGATVANVNGYWVYTTPAGKLLVEMFYQYPRRTESVTYHMDETGTLGKEVDRETPDVMLREILSCVELTPELAMDFGQYLVDTARSMGVQRPGEAAAAPMTKQ